MQHLFAKKAARYTRFVVFGRGVLWLSIAVIIGIMMYIAGGGENTSDKTRLVFSNIRQMGDLQNIMSNPHYQGFDKNNMPYAVLADKAIQQDAETVLLENIKADMSTKGGKWLALHAGAGEWKHTAKTLLLTKGVDMFYDGGYEFRSEHAMVYIDKGSATGDTPVVGQSPIGTLTANRFSVFDRGAEILFEGNVKMVIYRD